ncbi:MAG TPA: hypothetical protein VFF65_05440 [Phycisphaerales bacterium]|nr:hypothetical protein [Phycisphaerales bacterium]
MRVPGSKVYRAFPELDRFTDEQCCRFLKAVKRDRWLARIGRVTVIVAVFVATMLGVAVPSVIVISLLGRSGIVTAETNWGMAALLAALVLPVLAALLAAFAARDLVLRRRLRSVINDRGKCASCGYLLLGMPVRQDLVVICPECGEATEVDPSIAELQSGAASSASMEFRPTVRVGPPARTPEQRKRRRRVWLAVVGAAAAVVLTPLAMLGWNEVAMRIDARRAAAARPGVTGLQRVPATLPPLEAGNGVLAWNEFEKVLIAIAEADRAVWLNEEGIKDADGQAVRPDYSFVGEAIEIENEEARKRAEQGRDVADRMLPKMRELGVFDKMRAMREASDLTPVVSPVPGEPLMAMLMPELARCREIARINKARALTALRNGDPEEFIDAVRNIHALARMCERKPAMIARLVAIAIDAMGDGIARRALMTRREQTWIDAVAGARVGRTPRVPFAYTLESERVAAIDSACFFYEGVGNVRRRQLELAQDRMDRGGDVRVGRLQESLDEFNKRFDAGVAEAGLEVYQRTSKGFEQECDLWVVRTLLPALAKSQRSMDQVEADRRGIDAMLALERFRLARGEYPETLETLLPTYLAAAPLDSWTGKPFCYKRIDAAADPHGRGFLLYICGQDRTDDGGRTGEYFLDAISHPKLRGIDYIINDPIHLK